MEQQTHKKDEYLEGNIFTEEEQIAIGKAIAETEEYLLSR